MGKTSGSDLIKLDGSSGEGGGQILRSALTLSMLTGKPFRLRRVRANRTKPGLRPQHLTAVEAAAMLCGAEVVGGSVGSTDLTFRPGPIAARDLSIDIGTAGSTALVLQTIHLPLALRGGGTRLSLLGGTFNTSAPSFPFLEATWRTHLAAIGMPVSLTMPKAGYYPQGGGQLEAWIEAATPHAIAFEDRGELVGIRAIAEVTNLDAGIAQRMLDQLARRLDERGLAAETEILERSGPGAGTSIALVAEFEHGPPATFAGLGERGKMAEAVADEAVFELFGHLDQPGGAVDEHSADQILLPLAFAEGRSIYTVGRVSSHLRTNVETIQSFLDRSIRIEEIEGSTAGRVVIQ